MKKDSLEKLFSTVVLRWTFIVVLVLMVSTLVPVEAHNEAGPDIKEPLFFKVDISLPSEKAPTDISEIQNPETVAVIPLDTVEENSPASCRGEECEPIFRAIILEACNRHNVSPTLVKAVIMAESSYNPRAVSKKGAKGLMQLMPGTAHAMGVKDIFDPEQNINGGVKYLKKLLVRYDGDVHLALAAYNAGSKKVRKYRGIPPFKATRHYIKKIYRYYGYYKKDMTGKVDNV